MPILSYRDLLANPPKKSAYVVDTSFLIRALKPEDEAAKLKKALIANDTVLTYNVTVKNEAIHYMRMLMIEVAFEEDQFAFSSAAKKHWNVTLENLGLTPLEKAKQMSLAGYVDIFKVVFGKDGSRLKQEVDKALAGCIYADTKSFRVPLGWERLLSLMAMYGLDSSDAMILNFAVSDKTFNGVITADDDFVHCADGIDIVLPRSRKLPPWRDCLETVV